MTRATGYHVSLAETPCKNPNCADPLCFGHWDKVRARVAAEDAAEEETIADLTIRVVGGGPVVVGRLERQISESGETPPPHDCEANAVPYVSDGALGHGFECGVCGAFLQAG